MKVVTFQGRNKEDIEYYLEDDNGFRTPAKKCFNCQDIKPANNEFFYSNNKSLNRMCIECCKLRYVDHDLYQYLPNNIKI